MRSAAKQLRFPLGGIAKNGSYRETTYPTEDGAYSTPMALNVIGECAFSGRMRGGSRPGLKRVDGVSSSSRGRFLWPNGEVVRWPDGTAVAFDDLETAALPDGSILVFQHAPQTVYRNRLVKSDGSLWMASRTDDFGDFDFGGEADDVTKAVAGNLAYAGRKGEVITALCAFGDSRLFIATNRRLAVIDGEPTGAVATVSDNVGIIGANAWCNAEGALYFIGQNGMYAVGEAGAVSVSPQLPEDLKGLADALLVYDPHYRGIHVFTSRADYFYELESHAFWPVEYPATMRPVAGATGVIDNVNRVVFRCADGQYRHWDDAQDTDDGKIIISRVAIGPFKCGVGDNGDGMLDSLDVTLAEGSSTVSVGIAPAKTAEASVRGIDTAYPEYDFASGYNPVVRTRVRGAWATLVLESYGKWAYEAIQANIKNLGRLRP